MTPPTHEAIAALARELHAAWRDDGLPPFMVFVPRWILARFVRREEHCKDCCCARSWAALGEVSGADSIAGHIENMRVERDRLRAELRGQRCDGSGYLRGVESQNVLMCPSCPACKPTPIQEANRQANKELWLPKPTPDRCDCGGLYVGGKCVRQCDESEPAATPKGDRPVPPANDCRHLWSRPRDGEPECLWCAKRQSIRGGLTPESVSTAGGVHDDSPVQSAAPVPQVLTVKLHPETLRALGMFLLFANGNYNVASAADEIDALLAKLEETKP